MRVLYFGSYNPFYSRNRVLVKALKLNNADVIECRDNSPGFKKFVNLFLKFRRLRGKFDAVLVGFSGQEAMFLARFLTRKPIVFDAFTSHYGGYVLDRQYWPEKSLRAKYYRFLDKWSCKLADLVLLDTQAHIDFFIKEFNLPREKFGRVFVGADSDIFYPKEVKKNTDKFLVHFHGNYIPLQGVEYIIKAAKLLEKEDIIFNLIGRGQTYDASKELADKLGVSNINFVEPVAYDKLADYVSQADICLGIFGDTPKTELVIPNKVFEALAAEKAVITADTRATRELLENRKNILFCNKKDAEDLAEKITELKNDSSLRDKIASNGYELFNNQLRESILGSELTMIINKKFQLL